MRHNLNKSELREAIEQLIELQQELEPLVNQVADLVNQVGDEHAKSYVVSSLQIATMREHGWLTRDDSLQDVIEQWQSYLDEMDGPGEEGDDDTGDE